MDVSLTAWVVTLVVTLGIVPIAVTAVLSLMKSASRSKKSRADKAERVTAHAPAEEFLAER